MILITSYYESKNKQREEELLKCWNNNAENKAFEKIYRFIEGTVTNSPCYEHEVLLCKARPTYREYFDYANSQIESGTIVCLSNSDIWFDETLLNITDKQLDQQTFFACTRWGYMNDTGGWHWDEGYDKNAPVSQDAWLFRVPVNCSYDLNFFMGRMRCDNVLAYAMQTAGYRVLNPTLPGPKSLKLHHEHRSQVHNYGTAVAGPMIFVPPCHLG